MDQDLPWESMNCLPDLVGIPHPCPNVGWVDTYHVLLPPHDHQGVPRTFAGCSALPPGCVCAAVLPFSDADPAFTPRITTCIRAVRSCYRGMGQSRCYTRHLQGARLHRCLSFLVFLPACLNVSAQCQELCVGPLLISAAVQGDKKPPAHGLSAHSKGSATRLAAAT